MSLAFWVRGVHTFKGSRERGTKLSIRTSDDFPQLPQDPGRSHQNFSPKPELNPGGAAWLLASRVFRRISTRLLGALLLCQCHKEPIVEGF